HEHQIISRGPIKSLEDRPDYSPMIISWHHHQSEPVSGKTIRLSDSVVQNVLLVRYFHPLRMTWFSPRQKTVVAMTQQVNKGAAFWTAERQLIAHPLHAQKLHG